MDNHNCTKCKTIYNSSYNFCPHCGDKNILKEFMLENIYFKMEIINSNIIYTTEKKMLLSKLNKLNIDKTIISSIEYCDSEIIIIWKLGKGKVNPNNIYINGTNYNLVKEIINDRQNVST